MVLWGGLSLFIVVVAYIVQKRMLFFVPNSLSMGFFGATARSQRGAGIAHTNDPPPGCACMLSLTALLTALLTNVNAHDIASHASPQLRQGRIAC